MGHGSIRRRYTNSTRRSLRCWVAGILCGERLRSGLTADRQIHTVPYAILIRKRTAANVVRDTRTVRDGVRRRKGDDAGYERLHRLGNERHPFTDGAVFFRRDPFGYRLAPASFFERTIYIDRDSEPMAAAIVRRTLDIIVEEEQEEEKR